MFVWLENTDLALWVGLSLWAYPALLALHIVGLAVVVGIFVMRDLTLLGLIDAVAPAQFRAPVRLAFAGFCLNAASGFLLFTSQASVFAASSAFQVKIVSILIGMVLALQLQKRLRRLDSRIDRNTRLLAAVSLICWLLAISAGRLIAYLG